jgi:hypothetical protein
LAEPLPETTELPAPTRTWGRADALALAAWTAAVVLFFWDAVGFRGAFFYFDITEINYPYRDFFANELKAGRFSRWHPGLYDGLPLYSESQAGYLHPLKYLLYPWLPTWKAFNLDTVGSIWLAGVLAYGWLRRHVGSAGALTGAGVFAFSGYTWAHFVHTSMINALPSVPLAFWGVEAAWESGRCRGLVVAASALACQVFAGHLQDALLTGLALGVYGLYRAAVECGWRRKGRAIGTVLAAGLLGVGISAVQWLPSKELIDRTPRQALTWRALTYGSWSPELLPTVVLREAYGTRARDTDWMDGYYPYHEMDVYLGVVGLAMALVGAASHRDRWVGAWLVVGGVGLLLMLGRFTFLMDHFHQFPLIGRGRVPVRFHLWVALSASALAAVGVERLGHPGRVRLRVSLITIGLIVLASAAILSRVYEPAFRERWRWPRPSHAEHFGWLTAELIWGSTRTAAIGIAAFLVAFLTSRSRHTGRRALLAAALPALAIADLLGAHWNDTPTVDPSYWTSAPASARRLREDPAARRVLGEPALSSGEPGYASRPFDFLAVRELLAWSLPPVWGLSTIGGQTPILPRRRLTFTEMAEPRARFVVEGLSHLVMPTSPGPLRAGAERAGSVLVQALESPFPRARVMGRPVYVANEAEAGEALRRLGPAIRDRLIVEDPDRPIGESDGTSGSARIVREIPERVELVVEADAPGYLVLADSFDPGWSATLDGQPVAVRPAYAALRAVAVPSGRSRVVFLYEPAGFGAGLAVSILGSALALVLVFVPRRAVGLGDGHGPSSWPRHWPWIWAGAMILVVLASVPRLDRNGRPAVQERWRTVFHPFTWGAGIEAMRDPEVTP